MKKTLLSFLMIGAVGAFTATAQITIYDTDVVGAGDNVEQAHDTIPGGISIGSGGASQTWNFSAINEDYLDTMKFRNPSSFPGSSNFPTSNLGLDMGEDSTWMFLTKNTAGLFVNGQSQYQQGQLVTLPFVTTIITFPSTMNTNYGGNWNGQLFVFAVGADPDGPGPMPFIDSVRQTRAAILNSNIDGWGNVTTPFGTFPSLRQIVIEENIDTVWYATNGSGTWTVMDPITAAAFGIDPISYDTTRTARWWTDDPTAKFPVVEMDYEANGTVNHVSWQKSTPTVGIDEQFAPISNVALYPNPAKNNITINSNLENGRIEILDVTGKLIVTERFNQQTFNMNISSFKNGLYFYTIYDENGVNSYSDKFVVAK